MSFSFMLLCEGFLFARAGREVIEHLLYTFVEAPDVFVGLVRKCVAGRPPPEEFLGLRIEQIDNERDDLVVFDVCGCIAESTTPSESTSAAKSTSPPPADPEAVVVGVESAVMFCHLRRQYGAIAARFHGCPAFRCQSRVDGFLDPVNPQRILRLDLLPGVGFVSTKVRAAIIVSLHLLRE